MSNRLLKVAIPAVAVLSAFCFQAARADTTPPASVNISGKGITVGTFQSGAVAFADQHYTWQGVPHVISGWEYTENTLANPVSMTVSVLGDGWVYFAVPAKSPDLGGWTSVPTVSFAYSDAANSSMKVFKLKCTTGQAFTVPTGAVVLAPSIAVPVIATPKDLNPSRGTPQTGTRYNRPVPVTQPKAGTRSRRSGVVIGGSVTNF